MDTLPTQTRTPTDLLTLPSKLSLQGEYVGSHITSLRTPALVVDRTAFAENCARMHASAKQWNASFRAHVKTHKTSEGTRMQLVSTEGSTHSVVVSTMMEAWSLVRAGLVADGTINDILYGLPLAITKIADIYALAREMKPFGATMRLMIDNPDQIKALEAFNTQNKLDSSEIWSVFVKIDLGPTKRAGLVPGTPFFAELLKSTLESPAISIYGFYCHAGNSYASKSLPEASSFLSDEVNAVNLASQLALDLLGSSPSASRHTHPFVLSVGSTPTAHAFSSTAVSKLASLLNGTLELHAGNYPFCDLQQLATSLIPPTSIAQRIIASVISYYPGRGENDSDEAMCDAGAIAMSKDTGPWPGFGDVIRIHRPRAGGSSGASEGWQENGWRLGRMSQEHGIMVRKDPSIPIPEEERLELGAVVEIVGQHACLIAAAYPWYYVVEDGGDKVVDVWVPWKGW